jgi:hypothetical protein
MVTGKTQIHGFDLNFGHEKNINPNNPIAASAYCMGSNPSDHPSTNGINQGTRKFYNQ